MKPYEIKLEIEEIDGKGANIGLIIDKVKKSMLDIVDIVEKLQSGLSYNEVIEKNDDTIYPRDLEAPEIT